MSMRHLFCCGRLWRAAVSFQVSRIHRLTSLSSSSLSKPQCGHQGQGCHANKPILVHWASGTSSGRRWYNTYSDSGGSPNGYFTVPSILAATSGVLLCRNHGKNEEEKFIVVAKENDLRTLKKLLGSGIDVNCRHRLGWNALHAAVVNAKWETIKFLVENGADINAKDEFSSALRIASHEGVDSSKVASVRDKEFCSFINHYVSYSGFTPLHYAILLDDTSMVRFLLDLGADPTLENNRGYTPADYCTNEEITSLLEKYTIKLQQKQKQLELEERRRYPLEERLKSHIVGQEGPITAVAAAIRRRENGWADEEHPLVLLFLGSSGIGKTELAKQIANYIHNENKEGFIRLDMSEYQEKHEVAKLIGSPPGYIGHDKGGQLTSQLTKCPNAVVLFDEVDKAHPDVLTVMLQLFDEGRLTDGQGNTVNCKDALFVMTSNLASEEIAAHGLKLRREAQLAAEEYRDTMEDPQKHIHVSREFKDLVVEPILKRHFKRDEFLGRINEMLYFLPFSRSELNLLVEKQLKIWKERAMQRHSIHLTWEREALDVLADGYNVKYGARSIQHEVERVVVTQLADAFEQGSLCVGNKVCLVVETADKEGAAILKLNITGMDKNSHPIGEEIHFGSF